MATTESIRNVGLPCVSVGEQLLQRHSLSGATPQDLEQLVEKFRDEFKLNMVGSCVNIHPIETHSQLCFFARWWMKHSLDNLACDQCLSPTGRLVCAYHCLMVCVTFTFCKNHKVQYCIPNKLGGMLPRMCLPNIPITNVAGEHYLRLLLKKQLDELPEDNPYHFKIGTSNFTVILVGHKTGWKKYSLAMGSNSFVVIKVFPGMNVVDRVGRMLRNVLENIIRNSMYYVAAMTNNTPVQSISLDMSYKDPEETVCREPIPENFVEQTMMVNETQQPQMYQGPSTSYQSQGVTTSYEQLQGATTSQEPELPAIEESRPPATSQLEDSSTQELLQQLLQASQPRLMYELICKRPDVLERIVQQFQG